MARKVYMTVGFGEVFINIRISHEIKGCVGLHSICTVYLITCTGKARRNSLKKDEVWAY